MVTAVSATAAVVNSSNKGRQFFLSAAEAGMKIPVLQLLHVYTRLWAAPMDPLRPPIPQFSAQI